MGNRYLMNMPIEAPAPVAIVATTAQVAPVAPIAPANNLFAVDSLNLHRLQYQPWIEGGNGKYLQEMRIAFNPDMTYEE